MSFEQNNRDKSYCAPTASLNDREMMTYMKYPSPPYEQNGDNIDIKTDNGDEDADAGFLDGLFDSGSGGSDNGSDAQDGTGSNGSDINKSNSRRVNVQLPTNMQFPPPQVCRDSSSVTVSSLTSSNPSSTTRVPQHLLFAAKNQILPHNILHNQQQQQPLQANKMPTVPVQSGTTPVPAANNNSRTNTLSSLNHPWMVGTVQSVAPPTVSSSQSNRQPGVQPNMSLSYGMQAVGLPNSFNQNPNLPQQQQQNQQVHLQDVSKIIGDINSFIKDQKTSGLIQQSRSSSSSKRRHSQTASETPYHHGNDTLLSVSEDEHESIKRRLDRNMREQERSQKISNQIAQLKDLLTKSNVNFKPDKYSTLVSVHEYIRSLQHRWNSLEQEHKRLVATIQKTSDIVNKSTLGGSVTNDSLSSSNYSDAQVIPHGNKSSRSKTSEEDESIISFIRGLDYRSIFMKSTVALCVASIDGQIIECNDHFTTLFNLSQDVLIKAGLRPKKMSSSDSSRTDSDVTSNSSSEEVLHPLTLFNLVDKDEMKNIFEAMSKMLKEASSSPPDASSNSDLTITATTLSTVGDVKCWNGSSDTIDLNITLIRNKNGSPRFFNCALTKSLARTEHTY